jgi:hypothetical protein
MAAAGTYTYWGNLNPTDGTAQLVVASGKIPIGTAGVFTAGEATDLEQNYQLVAGTVTPWNPGIPFPFQTVGELPVGLLT